MNDTYPAAYENPAALSRLIALWGLAESGLGGIMFALKIPLTGFFIGAVAIVLLSLIAKYSSYSYRRIVSATVVVLMVKAAASPHSPPAAYFAVAFQGLSAALLFSNLRSHRLACVLLGALSMAESSLQKVLVLTIVFGKSIWEATNNLGKEVAKNFSVDGPHNYAAWLISLHVLLYVVWGILAGLFAARAPANIEGHKNGVLEKYHQLKSAQASALLARGGRRSKAMRWMVYAAILVFIIAVFVLSGGRGKQVTAILLRTVAALLLLFFVVQPLLKRLLHRWLKKRSRAEQEASREIIGMLPSLRSFVPDAYVISKGERSLFRRPGSFLLVMIILSLYAGSKAQHSAV